MNEGALNIRRPPHSIDSNLKSLDNVKHYLFTGYFGVTIGSFEIAADTAWGRLGARVDDTLAL